MMLAKLIGFLIVVFAANFLTGAELGNYTYAFFVTSFILPFLGFGSYQSLVYFGSTLKKEKEKQALFNYAFKRGLGLSALLSVILILFSGIFTHNLPEAHSILIILSIQLITFTLVSFIRNYARLINRNDIYGRSELIYNLILFFLVIAGIVIAKEIGYAMAMVLAPLITGLIYFKKLKIGTFKAEKLLNLDTKKFWSYGIFVSLGAVAAQLLYVVDGLMIGNFLPIPAEILEASSATGFLDDCAGIKSSMLANYVPNQIAIYRICSVIPLATFVLPLAILTTDAVHITEQKGNTKFLKNYIKNIWRVLLPVGILIAAVLHYGSSYILSIFDLLSEKSKYAGNEELISVFALGVIGAFLLRIPFGNLLSAVGKAKWNSYISFGMLGLNILLNYIFVREYGIIGAAWATTILIWVSGLVSFLTFKFYLSSNN